MATPKRKSTPRRGAQPRRRSRSRGSAPAWFYMLLGFMPGLLIAWLVHNHHTAGPDDEVADRESVTEAEDVATSRDADDRPRFEFYKLLSESEVVVPDEPVELRRRPVEEESPMPLDDPPIPEAPETATPETPRPDPGTAESEPDDVVEYLIQAGSFRNQEDADRLRARLALMGVDAEIQSVQIEGGETWHRVRIGPITDRSRADRVRARLEEENVSSILLRSRG